HRNQHGRRTGCCSLCDGGKVRLSWRWALCSETRHVAALPSPLPRLLPPARRPPDSSRGEPSHSDNGALRPCPPAGGRVSKLTPHSTRLGHANTLSIGSVLPGRLSLEGIDPRRSMERQNQHRADCQNIIAARPETRQVRDEDGHGSR